MNFCVTVINIIKTLFIPIVCICLAIVINFIEDRGEEKDLIIAILSARENFDKREALRSTWLGYVKSNPHLKDRVAVKFVIGDKACNIHQDDRIEKYSCQGFNFDHKTNRRNEMLAFIDASSKEIIPIESDNVGFDFKAHHDIVIAALGVLGTYIQPKQNAVVSLYDANHQNVLVSANFSVEDPGMLYGDWYFKTVKQMVYPKGFEGSLVTRIEGGNVWQNVGSMHLKYVEQDEGVITVKKGLRFIDSSGIEAASFEPSLEGNVQLTNCNLLYVLDDSEEVNAWLSGKMHRDQQRLDELTFESKSLELEQSSNNDLVFVDVLDVYSNIPSKLLEFYKWVSLSKRFKYLMKVDDDTFVNPHRLLKFLENPDKQIRSWWGSFRRNWKVNHYGKWTDLDYQSLTYPPFACGSGNILSSDLLHWIARNSRHLHCYQGEDISVGIWLAAVRPHYIHDSSFICDNECDQEMMLSAQNTIENIHIMWNRFIDTGNPCR